MMENGLSGDLGSIDFIWEARNETASLRRRYLAINQQILFCVIMIAILLRNTYRAGYVVFVYSRKLAPWCCLVTNLVGALLFLFISLPSTALGILSCYTLAWALITGVVVSSAVVNIVLFERAYLACNRPIWFLVLGIILRSTRVLS
ncbi:hypothetical protein BDF19DRAFT_433396 [Syncephalis fuscata]|nr:hypothetical protein BDF19DRAFT_433396 [Syncephalis fuscata]